MTDFTSREQLAAFVPDNVFDAYAGAGDIDDANWSHALERLLGKAVRGALIGGSPERPHAPVSALLPDDGCSRGLFVVAGRGAGQRLEALLPNDNMIGIDPHAAIGSAPEPLWSMADRHRLLLLLRWPDGAVAPDSATVREFRRLCETYPRANVMIVYSGRSGHALRSDALTSLRGLENIRFCTSASGGADALLPVLYEFGPRKLLYGTGLNLLSRRHASAEIDAQAAAAALESVRAVKQAAEAMGLGRADIEDIFFNNAMRLTNQRDRVAGPSYGLGGVGGAGVGVGVGDGVGEPGDVTKRLYAKAKTIIPGGTQLLGKRPEKFAPNEWPAYFSEARGCEVWDLDGNHYYDMSMNGIGACLLGFRDDDVTRAVQRRLMLGSMCTQNPHEEVELAERLIAIHPWARQVRYARTGGETCSVAVRIARATTGRSLIAVSGYHGWHDWYLSANLGERAALDGHLIPGLQPSGVPGELRGTVVTFHANDRSAFDQLMAQYGDRLAAVIMEPCRLSDPQPGFLQHVRDRAHANGALLIFDEVTIGWRLERGGSHLRFGVSPDIAVFAKSLGNGHPIGAIIGTQEAMEGAHRSFISSTYWTESIGPAAALATVTKMMEVDVPAHVADAGRAVQHAWQTLGEQTGLPVRVFDGYPCLAKLEFEHEWAQQLKTAYTIHMLRKGFLAGELFYPTLAHTERIIDAHIAAVRDVFGELANLLHNEDKSALAGIEVAHQGFGRLT